MARLNLTVPDPLYERLEQVRDRVNVSKVCAVALEKELDMIQARPLIGDPKIAQLVERLNGTSQRWYDLGHEDGLAWGVEHAPRAALQFAYVHAPGGLAMEWDAVEQAERAGEEWHANGEHGDPPYAPPIPPGIEALRAAFLARATSGFRNKQALAQAEDKADRLSYADGWQEALTDLWDAAAPALR